MTYQGSDSWVYFVEVDNELIPIKLRNTLNEIGSITLWSLYLPYVRIKFFRSETQEEEAKRIKTGIRKGRVLHNNANAIGFADYPYDVWIRYDLPTYKAIRVLVHEIYHIAQMRDYPYLRFTTTTSGSDLIKMEESASLFEDNFIVTLDLGLIYDSKRPELVNIT